MLRNIFEVCRSVFACYLQAVRSVDICCPADPRTRRWDWNPDLNPFWLPLVKTLRDIHSEIAYFMTLFNTPPFKLVWCFHRIPRQELIRLCGIRETIRQGAEETSDFSAVRDEDLHNFNDAMEAMTCIQQALHHFEAPEGLRLGPPRVPERLLAPLRAAFRSEGVSLEEDFYLQSFLRQPCSESILDCLLYTSPSPRD